MAAAVGLQFAEGLYVTGCAHLFNLLGHCGDAQVEVLGKVGDGAVAVDDVVLEDTFLDECALAAVSDSISKVVMHIFKNFALMCKYK